MDRRAIKSGLSMALSALVAVVAGCSANPLPFGGQCELLRFKGDQMLIRIQAVESVKSASFEELRQKIWDAGYESPLEFYEWFQYNRSVFMAPASGDLMAPEEREILQLVHKEAGQLGRSEIEGRFSEAVDNLVSSLKHVQATCPLEEGN